MVLMLIFGVGEHDELFVVLCETCQKFLLVVVTVGFVDEPDCRRGRC